MNIGIDLDSVIADIMPPLMTFFNLKYKTNYSLKDFKQYDLFPLWKVTYKESLRQFMAFYESEYFIGIKPVVNSVKGIDYLSKRHQLHVITSRPTTTIEKTTKWINKFFPNKFKSIYHTNQVSITGRKMKKSEVCLKLGVDVIFEDHIDYAYDCLSAGVKVYLIDMPWNKNIKLPKEMTRFYNWKEIKNLL